MNVVVVAAASQSTEPCRCRFMSMNGFRHIEKNSCKRVTFRKYTFFVNDLKKVFKISMFWSLSTNGISLEEGIALRHFL